jgi:hypothetical protein
MVTCCGMTASQVLQMLLPLKSVRRTHRTPKALRAKSIEDASSLSRKLWECARVLASLSASPPFGIAFFDPPNRGMAIEMNRRYLCLLPFPKFGAKARSYCLFCRCQDWRM